MIQYELIHNYNITTNKHSGPYGSISGFVIAHCRWADTLNSDFVWPTDWSTKLLS